MLETLTLNLPINLTKQLKELSGSSWTHKLNSLLRNHALVQIQEAESNIAKFETKHSQTFTEFKEWWDTRVPEEEKYSYEIEKDFTEWEGWIGERKAWLDKLKEL